MAGLAGRAAWLAASNWRRAAWLSPDLVRASVAGLVDSWVGWGRWWLEEGNEEEEKKEKKKERERRKKVRREKKKKKENILGAFKFFLSFKI